MAGLPCDTCGELLYASRLNRRAWMGVAWRHLNNDHEGPCAEKRAASPHYYHYGPEPADEPDEEETP